MENELSYKIIGAALEVHKNLGGPGLLESVYKEALCYEISLLGLSYRREVSVPLIYKNTPMKSPFFIDILVEEQLIIEVKATEKDNPIFESQTLTYLRLTGVKLGLIINFGKNQVKSGITRVVNGL